MNRIKKWLKRYLLAEIVGTAFALFFYLSAYYLTKNNIIAAVAGAWTETIGFFGTMILKDIKNSRKEHEQNNIRYTFVSFFKNARDIVFEFGFSEIADTWAIRPFAMYIFPLIIPNRVVGVLVGKFVSDIVYYGPAIIIFELRERRKNLKKS